MNTKQTHKNIVVIPDLHGRLDLLYAVLDVFPNAHYLSLGDAIDRGPQSMEVVRTLMELYDNGDATLLMGNHELMAADGILWYRTYLNSGDPKHYTLAMQSYKSWMRAGGDSVRAELGNLTLEQFPPLLEQYFATLERYVFVTENGQIHRKLPDAASVLVAHASPPVEHPRYADPSIAALWLRPFEGPFPLPEGVIYSLHGHTPIRNPMRLHRQVYVDLGAYETGRLSVVEIGNPYHMPKITVLCGAGRPELANGYVRFGELLPVHPLDLTGSALMTSRVKPLDQHFMTPRKKRHD